MEKNKKITKKEYVCICFAMIILIGIVYLCFPLKQMIGETQYQVICAGDSIFGNFSDETGIPALIAADTGLGVFNGGFGGTTLAKLNQELAPDQYMDSICGLSIMQAIAGNDFTWQKIEKIRTASMGYFTERIEDYSELKFNGIKVLFLEYGVNDFLTGVPLENNDNLYDEYTYAGALRTGIESLQNKYPDLKVVLVTPTYCTTADDNLYGIGTLADYVQIQESVAEQYNLAVIDNFSNSGITMDNLDEYTLDGIHLNERGRKIMAAALIRFLKETDL